MRPGAQQIGRVHRARSHIRTARGLTLIEILVVLLIVAGVMGMGVMMFGLVGQSQLKDEAMRLTSAIQYTYSQAALNNTPYRLVIDLETNEYYTEMGQGRVVVKEAVSDFQEGLLPEEARALEEERRAQRRDLFREQEDDPFGISRRVGYQRADEAVIKPRALKNDIRFESVLTSNFTRPVEQGKVAINFFPNGFQQQARIVLVDSREAKFTLITEPLTGRVRVYSGERDVDEGFGKEVKHGR